MNRMVHHLIDTLVFHRADGNDGYAEHSFHPIDAHRSAVTPHLVHHIKRQYHRNAKFHQLHGQVEVALDIGCIDNVDNAAGLAFQNETTADDLFACVRAEAVDAGQVGDGCIRMALDDTVLAVDGHAWDVADVLFAARQLVEQSRLSAVLITHERKGETAFFCR